MSIYKDMRKRNQKYRKTKGMERKIEKTAPLRGKGAFIGLILALTSGFCGKNGAQTVNHLHIHVLGGRQMGEKMA